MRNMRNPLILESFNRLIEMGMLHGPLPCSYSDRHSMYQPQLYHQGLTSLRRNCQKTLEATFLWDGRQENITSYQESTCLQPNYTSRTRWNKILRTPINNGLLQLKSLLLTFIRFTGTNPTGCLSYGAHNHTFVYRLIGSGGPLHTGI